MRVFTAQQFAERLGYQPRDWGLEPDEVVTIVDGDRIQVGERCLGHVNETELAMLERLANLTGAGRRWLWIGLGLTTMLVGGVAYAKWRKGLVPTDPEDAVAQAIQALGEDADPSDITDAAFLIAYPDCPPKLDPKDPAQRQCIDQWFKLRVIVDRQLPKDTQEPGPLSSTGPAADMRKWLDSLTQSQRSKTRDIIGSTYYDPIKRAAERGDDSAVVVSVLRFKRDAEKYANEHPLDALKQYNDLQTTLGPKLDELMDLAEQYKAHA